jgi:multidrug efflux pump subunit AcrA (membrane-fusion protein)
VAYQPVQLGPVIEGERIIRSGLKAGEEIVVNGLERVQPGMPVTVEKETMNASVAGRQTASR